MPVTLEGKLVVAISSRALFDFEEENRVFEQGDDRAYMQLQLGRLEEPAKPGVAFSLVRKLLAFNDAQTQRVEVVILSRNDPVSGMRVFRSAQHYGLPIQRGPHIGQVGGQKQIGVERLEVAPGRLPAREAAALDRQAIVLR